MVPFVSAIDVVVGDEGAAVLGVDGGEPDDDDEVAEVVGNPFAASPRSELELFSTCCSTLASGRIVSGVCSGTEK